MTFKLQTNMLAFNRSLELSDALMFARSSASADVPRIPIEVRQTGVRGQTSNATSKTDKENWGKPNPQVIDIASMPPDCDQLSIEFTLRVLANSRRPSASDSFEVATNFKKLADGYAAAGGYEELAWRYLGNIANGRFAWRNATIARNPAVTIIMVGAEVTFDPTTLSMDRVATPDQIRAAAASGSDQVDRIANAIAAGLSDSKTPADLKVEWVATVNLHAQIYPSQVYPGTKAARGDKSKFLASVPTVLGTRHVRGAIMHQQKIGAALRCIDDWHGVEEFKDKPVPANPYAGVQEMSVALRAKGKNNPIATTAPSLYDLFKKPALLEANLQDGTISDAFHFVMANLVRGGVYGAKD